MNAKRKGLLLRIIGALVIISILLGIWITYQVKASTQLTLNDLPYKIEFTKIDANWYLAMGIDSEGYLWGWGLSNHKVFGDSTNTLSKVPKKINDNMKFKDISVTDDHILAIDQSGYLWGWGSNKHGQLGNGSTSNEDIVEPRRIMSGTRFTKVSSGKSGTSMAIDAYGNLWSWGRRGDDLGLGNIQGDVLTPQKVSETIKFSNVKTNSVHTIAIDTEGNIWSWGNNLNGELGTGANKEDSNIPKKISSTTTFTEIAVCTRNSLAIDIEGNIWSWGSETIGSANSYVPKKITTGVNYKKISCQTGGIVTDSSFFAIDNEGKLWSWGNNKYWQLGNGTTENVLQPQKVMEEITFKEVSPASFCTLAIDTNGNTWSWGWGREGTRGEDGYAPNNKAIRITGLDYTVTFKDGDEVLKEESLKFKGSATAPLKVKEGYTLSWDKEYDDVMEDMIVNAIWTKNVNYTVKHYIQNDNRNGYTLKETETKIAPVGKEVVAKAKQYNGYRENSFHAQRAKTGSVLEDGSTTLELYYDKLYFTKEDLQYNINFKEFSANENTIIAIAEDGKLWGWGKGTLIDGNDENAYTPIPVPCDEEFIKVSISDERVMAIAKDGSLWSWGNKEKPVKIETELLFKDVSGNLLIDENGTLWNSEEKTQTGITTINITEQIKPDKTFKEVISNGTNNFAIDSEGSLWAWGENYDGEIGNNTTNKVSNPIQIQSGTTFKKVSITNNHTLALDTEGNIWAWGKNEYGQLGNATTVDSAKPIKLITKTKFKEISAGRYISMAIDTEGNIWAWGYNRNGELGNGTTTNSNIPIKLETEAKFDKIQVNTNSIAIDTKGNLWTWGNNIYGQLGIGEVPYVQEPTKIETDIIFKKIEKDYSNSSFLGIDTEGKLWLKNNKLTQIKSDRKFKEISAYVGSYLAIDTSGNLWAWGYNNYGCLGTGNTNTVNSPVQIQPGTIFKKISITYGYTLAIDTEGNIWAWGNNNYGQLGNGTTTNSSTPIKLETEVKFKEVYAGEGTSMAIDTEGNIWAWGNNDNKIYVNSKRWEIAGNSGMFNEINSYIPIKVTNNNKFTKIVIGNESMVALDEQGYLWSCGKKISNGKTIQLMPKMKFKEISLNYALDNDGNLWTWSNDDYYNPVKVEIDENANIVSLNSTLALTESGEVISFGETITPVASANTPIQLTGIKNGYTVTFKDGTERTDVQTINKGEDATAPSWTKAGYTLTWDKEFTNITEDTIVNAIWTPNNNTAYKVEHYVRNLDTEVEGYDLKETEEKTGTTDTTATAVYKEYEGFTKDENNSRNVKTGNIAGDGSLILKLYYSRNTYNITYELNGGTATGNLANSYIYGKEMMLSNKVAKEGYTFAGWYDNSEFSRNPITTIPATATGNKTLYAKWIEKDKEYYILSEKYNIDIVENTITKVSPETTVENFLSKIETNGTSKVLNANGQEVSKTSLVGTGHKLEVTYKGEVHTYEIAVRGDIDGNGKLTITDLSMLNQALMKKVTLTGIREKAANIDYIGGITITDLSMLNQALMKKIIL